MKFLVHPDLTSAGKRILEWIRPIHLNWRTVLVNGSKRKDYLIYLDLKRDGETRNNPLEIHSSSYIVIIKWHHGQPDSTSYSLASLLVIPCK